MIEAHETRVLATRRGNTYAAVQLIATVVSYLTQPGPDTAVPVF